MIRPALTFCFLAVFISLAGGQTNNFEQLDFLLGEWTGTGRGFGNDTSTIESVFSLIMGGKYIEVQNESRFSPTERNPEGEHHIDKGFISYDKSRKAIVFRQFNNEGYVNQYLLNDTLSSDSVLVFDTEVIENFMPGGKARWTIVKKSDKRIVTTFEVSFPGKRFTCFGTNWLNKN